MWGLVENKEVWHPFMTIRSTHPSHTTWSPHSKFKYLHLLEVRLQFYLNLIRRFCICWPFFFDFSWTNTIIRFIAGLKNGICTGQMIVFFVRRAKAYVKSCVYFADRLMTSKRSRSLFFTAWKTFLQQQATNNTLAKSPVPFYLLQLQIFRAKKISRKVKGNSQFMQKISYPCDNVWISGFLTSSLEMQR